MKVYYNGTILTMERDQPTCEAIAVDQGIIKQVGTLEEMNQKAEFIDLKGNTMMPSFIDPHSHFTGFANSLNQCDLSQAASFSEIVQLMKEFKETKQLKSDEWIIGTNYDHNFLEELKHPDKFLLDQISETNPVFISHASNHMGVVNQHALDIENLNDVIEDPVGGHYGRIENTSELNGYMEENAFLAFQSSAIKPDFDQLITAFKEAQDIYASYGITTMQEGMVPEGLFMFLDFASKHKLLKMDLVGYLDLMNCREIYQNEKEYKNYVNHFRIGGYKIFLDGSPQGKTAWMKTPYVGTNDYGYPTLTDDQLYKLILDALEDDAQLLAHCNGDAAADQYVTQFEHVLKDHHFDHTHRPVMIHAQTVQPHELRRMKKLEMMPSFFVAHTYYWGDVHIENFGKDRADMISPVREAINNDLVYTFHQDSPVIMPDMMKTIWSAVNRITKNGVRIGEDQCVSVQEALEAVTINAAYQYAEEKSKGSIKVGKRADLIILDGNPHDVEPLDLDKIKVIQTIKDGEIIFTKL